MKEIGKILKEKREKKKITLAQAHAGTKIQEKYLTALEEGNGKVFSAPVYYKSFLKSYSKYLGLDQELLLKQYEESNVSIDARERYDYEQNGEFFVKESYKDKDEEESGEEEFKIKKIEIKYIVAALLVVAVLLGVFFYLISEPVNETAPQAQTQAGLDVSNESELGAVQSPNVLQTVAPQTLSAQTLPVQALPAVYPEPPKTQQSALVQPKPEQSKTEPITKPQVLPAETQKVQTSKQESARQQAQISSLELRIEAVENVWVKVDSDGREQFQGTLLKDNSKTFKAGDNFSLKIGYTPGIKVFFNNEPVDVISGAVQDVNTINLKRDKR